MSSELKKMSLTECKKILQKNGSVYADQDILDIRDFLYTLAEMDYEVFLKLKKKEEEKKNSQSG